MGPLLCAFVLLSQETNPPVRIQANVPLVEFQNVDAREAIRWLFRQGLFGGTIAPEVRGVVTLNLRNVPWEVALQHVLRQVDATYRIEHGFIEVVLRDEGGLPTPPREPWPSVADRQGIEAGYRWLRYKVAAGRGKEIEEWLGEATIEDPVAQSAARGAKAYREFVDTERGLRTFAIREFRPEPRKSAEKWIAAQVSYAPAPGLSPIVYRDLWRQDAGGAWRLAQRRRATLRFENADIRDVLRVVWGEVGASYKIDPRVHGRVTLDLTGVPFENALQMVCADPRDLPDRGRRVRDRAAVGRVLLGCPL